MYIYLANFSRALTQRVGLGDGSGLKRRTSRKDLIHLLYFWPLYDDERLKQLSKLLNTASVLSTVTKLLDG